MVASGEFVFFVLSKAFLSEVMVVEGPLVGFFRVAAVDSWACEDFTYGFASVWMLDQGRVFHALYDLKFGAGATIRQNFFVGVGGHGGFNLNCGKWQLLCFIVCINETNSNCSLHGMGGLVSFGTLK